MSYLMSARRWCWKCRKKRGTTTCKGKFSFTAHRICAYPEICVKHMSVEKNLKHRYIQVSVWVIYVCAALKSHFGDISPGIILVLEVINNTVCVHHFQLNIKCLWELSWWDCWGIMDWILFLSTVISRKHCECKHVCAKSLFEPTMGRCRYGRAARKRRHKQESAIQSGINVIANEVLL